MKISALSPWFGSKRTLAPEIIRQLGPHRFYFEGCFGSLAVILAKPTCEHEMACDLHGAITNLAWVVQGPLAVRLFERLQRVAYSDDIYRASKEWLAENEVGQAPETADLDWAYHYFLASWMGRTASRGRPESIIKLQRAGLPAAALARFAFGTRSIRSRHGGSG